MLDVPRETRMKKHTHYFVVTEDGKINRLASKKEVRKKLGSISPEDAGKIQIIKGVETSVRFETRLTF